MHSEQLSDIGDWGGCNLLGPNTWNKEELDRNVKIRSALAAVTMGWWSSDPEEVREAIGSLPWISSEHFWHHFRNIPINNLMKSGWRNGKWGGLETVRNTKLEWLWSVAQNPGGSQALVVYFRDWSRGQHCFTSAVVTWVMGWMRPP